MNTNTLVLNNIEYTFEDGQTILDVATQNRVDIPTLCYLEGVEATGGCNICVVELKGKKDLVRACCTKAENGMNILTRSAGVVDARKKQLKALLESGNHNCSIGSSQGEVWTAFQMDSIKIEQTDSLCPRWGDCELQNLAYEYQVQWYRDSLPEAKFPKETVNPLIIRDFSRCIMCGRCVAACNDIQVNCAIRMPEASDSQHVLAGKKDVPLKDSNCVFCGECVQACPVGALVEKKSQYVCRPWEVEKIRTTCPYCGVGCQQQLHVKDGKILKVTGVKDGSPNKGRLCVKGRFGFDFIYSQERLTTPLIKENGVFREASWDEALDLVAAKFKAIISQSGSGAVAGVSCARSINEDSYQMQKLFRAVFKTNNIDHCART